MSAHIQKYIEKKEEQRYITAYLIYMSLQKCRCLTYFFPSMLNNIKHYLLYFKLRNIVQKV